VADSKIRVLALVDTFSHFWPDTNMIAKIIVLAAPSQKIVSALWWTSVGNCSG
jgi:hypothetical protein